MSRHLLTDELMTKITRVCAFFERFTITSDGPVKVVRQGDAFQVRSVSSPPQTPGRGGGDFHIQVTDVEEGGGKYTVDQVLAPEGDLSGSGDLTAADLGGSVVATGCLAFNTVEQDREDGAIGDHILAVGSVWPAKLLKTNSDGRKVFEITALKVGCADEE